MTNAIRWLFCCFSMRLYRRHNNVHKIESNYGQQQPPFFFRSQKTHAKQLDWFVFFSHFYFVVDKSNVALFTVDFRRRRKLYKTEWTYAKCQLFIYSQIELSIDENKIPKNRTAKPATLNKRRWLAHNLIRLFRGHIENKQMAAEIRMRMKKGNFSRLLFTQNPTTWQLTPIELSLTQTWSVNSN